MLTFDRTVLWFVNQAIWTLVILSRGYVWLNKFTFHDIYELLISFLFDVYCGFSDSVIYGELVFIWFLPIISWLHNRFFMHFSFPILEQRLRIYKFLSIWRISCVWYSCSGWNFNKFHKFIGILNFFIWAIVSNHYYFLFFYAIESFFKIVFDFFFLLNIYLLLILKLFLCIIHFLFLSFHFYLSFNFFLSFLFLLHRFYRLIFTFIFFIVRRINLLKNFLWYILFNPIVCICCYILLWLFLFHLLKVLLARGKVVPNFIRFLQ